MNESTPPTNPVTDVTQPPETPTEARTDLVADPLPRFIEQLPIRQVFPREADFERLFAAELEDDDSTLPDLLGIDAGLVVRQQQTDGLRPDVLVYRVSDDGTRCEAVIEITLEALDVDHLRRAVAYAIENHANSLTIITKAIGSEIIEMLERYRERTTFNINVLILRVYLTGEEQYGFHLEPAFPDEAEQESTTNNAQRTLLELTKRYLYRLQDSSLQHLRVQANGRIDWYPEGANIRLYAAKAYTSITIKIFDRDDAPSQYIHHEMMRDSDEFEAAVTSVLDNQADYEISWHDHRGKATEPRLLIRIRYGEGRSISDLDSAQLEQAANRIARIFHRLRLAAMKHIYLGASSAS